MREALRMNAVKAATLAAGLLFVIDMIARQSFSQNRDERTIA